MESQDSGNPQSGEEINLISVQSSPDEDLFFELLAEMRL